MAEYRQLLSSPKNWPIPLPAAAAMVVGLILVGMLYRPVLTSLLGQPFQGEQFGLGAFAVAISAWLVWQRREDLAAVRIRPGLGGVGLLLGGVGIYVFSQRMGEQFPASMSLPVSVLGVVTALWGWGAGRLLLVPILFLAGAFPLPISVAGTIAFPLQNVVAAVSATVCGILGSPVFREGVNLLVNDHWVRVADVCSGLSSFTALLWLWLLFVYLRGGGNWRRQLLLLFLLLPIAVAANVARVVIVVLIVKAFGPGPAFGWFHEVLSLIVFGGTLAACFALIPPPREGEERGKSRMENGDGGEENRESEIENRKSTDRKRGRGIQGPSVGDLEADGRYRFRWWDGVVYAGVLALLMLAMPLAPTEVDFGKLRDVGAGEVNIPPDLIPLALGPWQGEDLGEPPSEIVGPRPPRKGEFFYRQYQLPSTGPATGDRGRNKGSNPTFPLYFIRSARGRDAFIDIESITLNQGLTVSSSEILTFPVGERKIRARQLVLRRGPWGRVYVYSYFGPWRSAVSRIGYKSLIALERGWLGYNPTWSLLWVMTEEVKEMEPQVQERARDLFRRALEAAVAGGGREN